MLGLSKPAANPFRGVPQRRFSGDVIALPRIRRLAEERRPPPFTTLRMEKAAPLTSQHTAASASSCSRRACATVLTRAQPIVRLTAQSSRR